MKLELHLDQQDSGFVDFGDTFESRRQHVMVLLAVVIQMLAEQVEANLPITRTIRNPDGFIDAGQKVGWFTLEEDMDYTPTPERDD